MEASANIYNEDCIAGLAERVADNSVHLVVTSIPFEELFTYSGKLEDVGNNGSTVDIRSGRFALNMRFVCQQLFRVTAPGCSVCIHIQQLLAYKNQHGFSGRRDFRGAMIDVFSMQAFQFVGEVAIPKNPQVMAQRLSLHSLQFKTGHSRDANDWAPAPNDYVLIFKKPGECQNPVKPLVYKPGNSPASFREFSGQVKHAAKRLRSRTEYLAYLRKWAIENEAINPGGWLAPADWIKWAKGTWEDIEQMDVLDGWRSAREHDEEKHVCPLQLSLIYRLVSMYTNPITIQPDVTVLDPFMGIGSTAFTCLGGDTFDGELPEPRNVIGFELKETYFQQAERNIAKLRKAKAATKQPEFAGMMQGGTGEATSEAMDGESGQGGVSGSETAAASATAVDIDDL